MTGLSDKQVEQARDANSDSEKDAAALTFARQVVNKRGQTSDEDFNAVRQAGFSDGEIAEIIAHVALNIFRNYFNNSAQTEIDFPRVELHRAA
jgi:alkylhydroperoxidase family enzyme